MHMLKLLAAATMVIAAIGATTAASAFAGYYIESVSGGSIAGSQVSKLQLGTDVGTVKPSVFKVAGSQNAETELTGTVHPEWSGASLAGLPVTVSSASCSLRLETPITSPALHASLTILCSSGTSISVHESLGLGCELSLPPQGPLSAVSFTSNVGGTVTVTFAVSGLAYTDNGKCPSTTTGHTSSTGTLSGSVQLSGSAALMVT